MIIVKTESHPAFRDGHFAVFSAKLIFLMTLFALSAPAATAQETYPPEVEAQCRDDYLKHCSPYGLGTTELRRCMEARGKQLSNNCQRALVDAGLVRTSQQTRK